MSDPVEHFRDGSVPRTAEEIRLEAESRREPGANWKRWGPYISERQWATVRECASNVESPWHAFPHDLARSTAYRWGEDGLLGITDRQCRLCFALALWNEKDPILKERLFGLGGHEGNHAEDVKECYFYLDSTPTHSYMKGLYKYPQAEFPYDQLRKTNVRRTRHEAEYELTDTGIFDENRFHDVFVEYAKASPDDILINITIANRGPEAAVLHVLPTLWFRNTWTRPTTFEAGWSKPRITQTGRNAVLADHENLGRFRLLADNDPNGKPPAWLFTENDTNVWRREDRGSHQPSCKDAFHILLVDGKKRAVNPSAEGTKTAAHYKLTVPAQEEVTIRLRLVEESQAPESAFGESFKQVLRDRQADADEFYQSKAPANLTADEAHVLRQASAGLLWSKQFYFYSVEDWCDADAVHGHAPDTSKAIRNGDWPHLYNRDVISMPDTWEYPWYAAWDSAFHMIPFADLDPYYAKEQLLLFLREWYMHPDGRIPAYEWNFSDVNPPVHAWACWRVYQLTGEPGHRDRKFLARVFQKLLLNFTWWVNRKDVRGKHVFTGGFLGLDNIGIFDRSRPLPISGHLEQADGTAWMAYYCSSMLSMALKLGEDEPAYEDMATKFFEHYVAIAEAMNSLDGTGLWDEEDGFYYDHIHVNGDSIPLKVRSMVGIMPLFTVDVIDEEVIRKLPGFRKRMDWFEDRKRRLGTAMTYMETNKGLGGDPGLRLLAIPTRERFERILRYVLDENEFLSEYGVRSLSKFHEKTPFVFHAGGEEHVVRYVPGESDTWMFGGNSNWRGPVWFPLNYLLIEAFERYHQFYGDSFRVECPTGSGTFLNLQEVADEIRLRLSRLFLCDEQGVRPCYARGDRFVNDPYWRELILFYEYFHGDTGRGMGASHQTGWTALVSPILQRLARMRAEQ